MKERKNIEFYFLLAYTVLVFPQNELKPPIFLRKKFLYKLLYFLEDLVDSHDLSNADAWVTAIALPVLSYRQAKGF